MQVMGFVIKPKDASALVALAKALGRRVWLKDFDPRDARDRAFAHKLRILAEKVVESEVWSEFSYGEGALVVNWKERDKAPPVKHLYSGEF